MEYTLRRMNGNEICTVEIDCAESAPERERIGAALRSAYQDGRRDFCEANMLEANMVGADMTGANMCGAYMRYTNMSGADMRDADISGAYMRGANVFGASMCGANMRRADMCSANMRVADMGGAKVWGSLWENTILNRAVTPPQMIVGPQRSDGHQCICIVGQKDGEMLVDIQAGCNRWSSFEEAQEHCETVTAPRNQQEALRILTYLKDSAERVFEGGLAEDVE